MKKDKVRILVVGDNPGLENSLRLFEIDALNKIARIDIPKETFVENRGQVNLLNIPNNVHFCDPSDAYDLVYVGSGEKNALDLSEDYSKYYQFVAPGGIFCGDLHHTVQVKEALVKFRNGNKITIPIFVSNRLCWGWWKK